MSNGKIPISFIKLPDDILEEICKRSAEKQERCKTGSSPRKRLSFVKHSDKLLQEAFKLKNESHGEKYKLVQLGSFQSRKSKTKTTGASVVYNRKSTIIKRKSTDFKKNLQIKLTNIPEIVLSSVDEETKPKIRKALFKVPSAPPSSEVPRYASRSRKIFQGPKWSEPKPDDQSPLIDIEKAEYLLAKKRFFLKTDTVKLEIPQNDIERSRNISPSTSGTTMVTENSRKSSSDSEFEALEQKYEKECPTYITDQIRKVRDVMKNEREEFQKIIENQNKTTIQIESLINELKQDKDKFQKFAENQNKRILQIDSLLKELENYEHKTEITNDKENALPRKRRSQSSTPSKTPKLLSNHGSSNKTQDLRINLLKSKAIENENKTPKALKAQKMYNSLRRNFYNLETPKAEKTLVSSQGKNTSVKIFEQCKMLLDTPKDK